MRIAWLCPYLPAPATSGGRIRIGQLARSLAHHELNLFARLSTDDDLPENQTAGLAMWTNVQAQPQARVRFVARTPKLPKTFPQSLRVALVEEDRKRPFDVVVAEHCYATYRLPRLSRAPVVLNEHNIESDYWLGELKNSFNPTRLLAYLRWHSFERRCWRLADAVTAVSPRDAQRIEAYRRDSCLVVSNGVATEAYNYIPPSERTGHGILFVGVMSYQPNVLAAQRLVREVLPRVRSRIPDAWLTLAGRDPGPKVRALEGNRVRVTGTVPSLTSLFDEHAVCANPVQFGGGSSLKVLEPLISGLPLVAGPFAARGYPLESDRHYLRADSDVAMAEAICCVLTDRTRFDEMARQAREVADRHAWTNLARPFAALVERIGEEGRSGSDAALRTCTTRPS